MESRAEDDTPLVTIHGRIYELPDLWDNTDDWTGVTGTAERKRRQNRLNQRAWRRRQKTQGSLASQPDDATTSVSKEQPHQNTNETTPSDASQGAGQWSRHPGHMVQDGVPLYDDTGSLLLKTPVLAARARELIRQAYHDHMLHAPRPESLQMLIRLNLLNALASNAAKMGFSVEGLCRDEFVSPFNSFGPHRLGSTSAIATRNCPVELQPTPLQCMVVHHPWIDLFPFPGFRDNMLRVLDAGLFDDDDLCSDVLEVWGDDLDSRPSLVIWGDSWDRRAWEASPAFLLKWGWLIKDCPELLEATNYWREKRGQRRLELPPPGGPTNEAVEAFGNQKAKDVSPLSILHE